MDCQVCSKFLEKMLMGAFQRNWFVQKDQKGRLCFEEWLDWDLVFCSRSIPIHWIASVEESPVLTAA